MASPRQRILISGAGIAGPTLAWWLHRFGFQPAIIEIAPKFRTGGYMIDFWGKGFELVDRMGLLPEVEQSGYHLREVRFVDSEGRRAGGFSTDPFWTATDGRFTSLPRSDLAGIIWRALPSSIDARFDDEVERIEPAGSALRAHFRNSSPEIFDLVIGADGLHSRVRGLIFGSEAQFEAFLGYAFAAFTVEGYEPRTPDAYVTYGVPGRQVSRFAMRDDRTMILFVWREEDSNLPEGVEDRRTLLRNRFAGMGWECDRILSFLDGAKDLYIDAVSQIRLPAWSKGRIALVGDAAWAPSFLAGEGCGLGIIGAYVLAGELARSAGDPSGFVSYEQRLRTFMKSKQDAASRFAGTFCPKTRLGMMLRNWGASLLNVRPIAKLALSSSLVDDIELPNYP